MIKTLIVSYTPRIDSNTNKLLQTFIKATKNKSEITHIDLVKNPAPLLLEDNLNALLKRSFMGLPLTETEEESVKSIDYFLDLLLDADRVVIAFPMYNFGVPASIKAWIDVVIQNGKTYKMNADGSNQGLCQSKKALVLMTTGGDFSQEPAKSVNYATPLMQTCLGFMGIESHTITAYGLNQYMDKVDDIVLEAQQKIESYLKNDSSW